MSGGKLTRVPEALWRGVPSGGARAATPIFLHGLWRSGSTYVWSRFRALEDTYCYYEPLHQGLGRLRAGRIARDHADLMEANAHPRMCDPYFEEFRPLLKRRGVRGFRRRFAVRRYLLETDAADPALAQYIGSLTEHAQAAGRVAVLGFNRSCLRAGWLKQHFPSCNIYIDRDPLEVWDSYRRQVQQGNYFFFAVWLLTVERNAAHPLLKPLAERLPLRRWPAGRLVKHKRYYRKAVDAMSDEQTYFMVHYLWAACALHCLTHCDGLVDMNGCARAGYPEEITNRIRAQCGLPVSFDDLLPVENVSADLLPSHLEVEQEVLNLFPRPAALSFADPAAVRSRLAQLSERKARILEAYL